MILNYTSNAALISFIRQPFLPRPPTPLIYIHTGGFYQRSPRELGALILKRVGHLHPWCLWGGGGGEKNHTVPHQKVHWRTTETILVVSNRQVRQTASDLLKLSSAHRA